MRTRRQTMKNSASHRNKTHKMMCKNEATYMGLHHWYVSMFEKLGWMVLAKSKGDMEDKIVSYKKSLKRLEEKIRCKMNKIQEEDRRNDLHIMLENVEVLLSHAYKDL